MENATRTGKLPKTQCRVSGIPLNRQSYPDHLKNVHGDASGNVREKGQGTLESFLRRPAQVFNIIFVNLYFWGKISNGVNYIHIVIFSFCLLLTLERFLFS